MMKKQVTSILFAMAAAATGFGVPLTPEANAATERIPGARQCTTDFSSWRVTDCQLRTLPR